jgi:hypothetical protein
VQIERTDGFDRKLKIKASRFVNFINEDKKTSLGSEEAICRQCLICGKKA